MADDAHFSGHIDAEELDEFDDVFGVSDGRTRSDALREAIRLSTTVKEAIDRTGLDFDDARAERMAVSEAIRRMAFDEWGGNE